MQWMGNRSGPVPDAELLSLLKEVELSGAAPCPFAHNAGNSALALQPERETQRHTPAQQHHVASLTPLMCVCMYIGVWTAAELVERMCVAWRPRWSGSSF